MAKHKQNEDIMNEKFLNAQEELVKISRERMMSIKSAMQTALDDQIMAMDISGMDEKSCEYWQKKKRAILDCPE